MSHGTRDHGKGKKQQPIAGLASNEHLQEAVTDSELAHPADVLQRTRTASSVRFQTADVLAMQTIVGNRAVQRKLAKREPSPPGDSGVIQRHLDPGTRGSKAVADLLLKQTEKDLKTAEKGAKAADKAKYGWLAGKREIARGFSQGQALQCPGTSGGEAAGETAPVQRHLGPDGTAGKTIAEGMLNDTQIKVDAATKGASAIHTAAKSASSLVGNVRWAVDYGLSQAEKATCPTESSGEETTSEAGGE